jgi:uncharacterized membrane protein
MTAPHADQIIDGYLARLEVALSALPAARRQELLDDVRTHIAEARGALTDETDAALLNIIDRLGDPAETATAEIGSTPPAAAPAQLGSHGNQNLLEIAAVVFLLIFWPVGVILLWISDVWTTRDKLIGTLVPPGGYLTAFVIIPVATLSIAGPVCQSWSGTDSLGHVTSGTTCPQGLAAVLISVLGIALLVFLLVGPIVTAAYLAFRLRRARRLGMQGVPARLVG